MIWYQPQWVGVHKLVNGWVNKWRYTKHFFSKNEFIFYVLHRTNFWGTKKKNLENLPRRNTIITVCLTLSRIWSFGRFTEFLLSRLCFFFPSFKPSHKRRLETSTRSWIMDIYPGGSDHMLYRHIPVLIPGITVSCSSVLPSFLPFVIIHVMFRGFLMFGKMLFVQISKSSLLVTFPKLFIMNR
jgi:hypothetical protein